MGLELGFHYAVVLPYLGAFLVALGLGKEIASGSGWRLVRLGLVLLVAGWLIYMIPFINLDYRLMEVAKNSNEDLDLILRISTAWAGGGGSLYLFTTLVAASILYGAGRSPPRKLTIVAGLTVLVVWASALLNGAFDVNTEGARGLGLNPLLKNYWIVPHPLTTFGGYALLLAGSIIVLFAGNRLRGMGVFLLGWSLLTFGIMFGAIWSYTTFGWGGYWAWDPVEISELAVWLVATATLHMLGPLSPLQKPLFYATMSVTLFAPFVTRSGLSPLHSFAAADIGSAILLVAGVIALAPTVRELAIHLASLDPSRLAERLRRMRLSDLSITVAGGLLAVIAFFVYASLLIPGILVVLGREATVPTMREGVDFYHPVLFPLFTLSLLWLPGYFLEKLIGRKGFTSYIVVTLALTLATGLAAARGTLTILPGAPENTNIMAAIGLAVSGPALGALLVGVIWPFARPALRRQALRNKFTALRDVSLKLLHAGMVLAFIGVLLSGTYAFNDTFFRDYTLRPGEALDLGYAKITLVDYQYRAYSGTVDLRSHISGRAATAFYAWAGLNVLREDIGQLIRLASQGREKIESNESLRCFLLTAAQAPVYNGTASAEWSGTASITVHDAAQGTVILRVENTSASLRLVNSTYMLGVSRRGEVLVRVFPENLSLTFNGSQTLQLSFHNFLTLNITPPLNVTVENDNGTLSLSIESLTLFFPPDPNMTRTSPGSVEVVTPVLDTGRALLEMCGRTWRLPYQVGLDEYVYMAVATGQAGVLNLLEGTPYWELLGDEVTMTMIAPPNAHGELPLLPTDAPSGDSLELTFRVELPDGSVETVKTRIRFEANGEAVGIHGLVSPTVLVRLGSSDLYISVHPPNVRGIAGVYHEPLVYYVKHAVETLPPEKALSLIAVMAAGYNINMLQRLDLNHAGVIVENATVDLLTLALQDHGDGSALEENGLALRVKVIPRVNILWAGVTLMGLSGGVLGALYFIAARRAREGL